MMLIAILCRLWGGGNYKRRHGDSVLRDKLKCVGTRPQVVPTGTKRVGM